jgi:hypothetical protein
MSKESFFSDNLGSAKKEVNKIKYTG